MTTSTIIEKIRKLRALAGDSGSSEAEAASAARIARNLMIKHALEESDLDAGQTEKLGDEHIEVGTTAWRLRLAAVLAEHCNCDILVHPMYTNKHPGTRVDLKGGWKNRKFAWCFGTPADLAILSYLYEVAERLVMKAAKDWREAEWYTPSRRAMNSFRMGAVLGLGNKLSEQRDAETDTREGEEAALVLASRYQRAVAHRKKLVPNVRSSRGSSVRGSEAGRQAGKRLNLNKGLTQRAGHRMLKG